MSSRRASVVGVTLLGVCLLVLSSGCGLEALTGAMPPMVVDLTVFAQVEQGGVLVSGRENLPLGALLSCVLEHQDDPELYRAEGEVAIYSSRYDLRVPMEGWPPGLVTVTVTFDPGAGQPAVVSYHCGPAGENLSGPDVVELDSGRGVRVMTVVTIAASGPEGDGEIVITEAPVYIPSTGTIYHKLGCRKLKRSVIPISLADAKAKGFTPCSECRPPD